MPLAGGTRVGPYEITALLGAGGMGEVYRAHDDRLDRDVALKLLPSAWFADDTARARLLREARSAAGLNHPNAAAADWVEGNSPSATLIDRAFTESQPIFSILSTPRIIARCAGTEQAAFGHALAGALVVLVGSKQ
jgi:serine/threonine protein kinase